jgi:hypothetical protein
MNYCHGMKNKTSKNGIHNLTRCNPKIQPRKIESNRVWEHWFSIFLVMWVQTFKKPQYNLGLIKIKIINFGANLTSANFIVDSSLVHNVAWWVGMISLMLVVPTRNRFIVYTSKLNIIINVWHIGVIKVDVNQKQLVHVANKPTTCFKYAWS